MILLMRSLGHSLVNFFASIGKIGIFTLRAVFHSCNPPFYPNLILKQMIEIGFYSLPVVALTAIFSGMVIALQSSSGFSLGGEKAIANVVVWGITRELGPVLAGLMVAGRIGASIAAEIGTMRVSEQIDALETLSTNPFKFLIGPRVIAGVIMLPLLVIVADIIGIMGGFIIATFDLGFNPDSYIRNTWTSFEFIGFISGIVKAAVFGFIITIMGAYHGYYAKGGSQGVGQATTNAVVSASILLLLFNFILTAIFFAQ
ncbi:MAG: ABC transporter permease [Alphaproteobacteria bacterium]|jgi:phospholipid/cholesterol/gamma-HCH transport system permease protein|nr:ABC transporter permease [Alphaproteobacteria bacterium]PPR13525.1 MAG: putative phospholipid ABC transporter permease protein MlaE [Alphaproteobacteria bacterium MarineAlpha12_Bin1]|tara:strand:+ start:10209 stop:10982 length:774 start_codon:yes stop_codon:yes gene_type:complete